MEIGNLEVSNQPDKVVNIADCFNYLKVHESKPANPLEKITIGKINSTDPEYQRLVEVAAPEEINSQSVPRGKLLEAGFIFNNCPLFPIEKPLLNVVIDGVDYGKRKLLTQKELDKVRIYQRTQPELYGTEAISTDEFRTDMLSLMLSAGAELPMEVSNKANFVRMALDKIDSGILSNKSTEDRFKKDKIGAKVAKYYKQLVTAYRDQMVSPDVGFFGQEINFIDEHFNDLLPWEFDGSSSFTLFNITARGHRMYLNHERYVKLITAVSPFLDCGLAFRDLGNPDYLVIGKDEKGFRVNMLQLHLLSRGISEMGEGIDGRGEQDYNIGHYEQEMYPADPKVRENIHTQEQNKFNIALDFDQDALILKVIDRWKKLALEWAEKPEASKEVKDILSQIKKIESKK